MNISIATITIKKTSLITIMCYTFYISGAGLISWSIHSKNKQIRRINRNRCLHSISKKSYKFFKKYWIAAIWSRTATSFFRHNKFSHYIYIQINKKLLYQEFFVFTKILKFNGFYYELLDNMNDHYEFLG